MLAIRVPVVFSATFGELRIVTVVLLPPPGEPSEDDAERRRFAKLFDEYYQPIFSYIIRRIGNWDDAKDIASDVFLKAFTAFPKYEERGRPVGAWLYRIATREVGMYFRRGRRTAASLDQLLRDAGFEPVDPATLDAERREAERILQLNSDFMALSNAIAKLPVKYQDVITLRYFERKSVREVALILGKAEGTVKSLLSRGIARLRASFRCNVFASETLKL